MVGGSRLLRLDEALGCAHDLTGKLYLLWIAVLEAFPLTIEVIASIKHSRTTLDRSLIYQGMRESHSPRLEPSRSHSGPHGATWMVAARFRSFQCTYYVLYTKRIGVYGKPTDHLKCTDFRSGASTSHRYVRLDATVLNLPRRLFADDYYDLATAAGSTEQHRALHDVAAKPM